VAVGGENGWTLQAYSPLHILAGDSLGFSYNETAEAGVGAHDVWRLADADAFETCSFLGGTFLGTNDVVVKMRKPGTFYFASSTNSEENCLAGQKVAVVVTKGEQQHPTGQYSTLLYAFTASLYSTMYLRHCSVPASHSSPASPSVLAQAGGSPGAPPPSKQCRRSPRCS